MFTKKGIGGVGLYVASTNFSLFVNTALSLALRLFIPVEYFGVTALVTAMRQNFEQLSSPICNVADIQIPLHAADASYVSNLIRQLFQCLTWVSFLQMFGMVSLSYLYWDDSMVIFVFLCAAVALPFGQYARLSRIVLKGKGQFYVIFKASVFATILSALTLLYLSFRFDGYGYLVGIFLASVISGSIYCYYIRSAIGSRVALLGSCSELLRILAGFGLIYSAYSFMIGGVATFDRIILGHMGGVATLGLYSFGASLANLVRALPRALIGGILPMFLAASVTSVKEVQRNNVVLYQRIVIGFSLIVVIMAVVAVELLVPAFLPEYTLSIPAAEILFISVIAQGASAPLVAECLSNKRVVELLLGSGGALGALFLCSNILTLDVALIGVAYSVLIAYIVNFSILYFRRRREVCFSIFVRTLCVLLSCWGLFVLRCSIGPSALFFSVLATAAVVVVVDLVTVVRSL